MAQETAVILVLFVSCTDTGSMHCSFRRSRRLKNDTLQTGLSSGDLEQEKSKLNNQLTWIGQRVMLSIMGSISYRQPDCLVEAETSGNGGKLGVKDLGI